VSREVTRKADTGAPPGTAPGAPPGDGPDGLARLRALSRPDKWFLSAGDGFLWAPPFPRWLHRPGFWDPAHVYHYPLGPLFSVALVDASGRADALARVSSAWRPDRLEVRWRAASGTELTERRYVLPGGRFCSAWTVAPAARLSATRTGAPRLVAFTAVPGEDVRALGRTEGGARWVTTLRDRKKQTLPVGVTLEAVAPDESVSIEMPRVWCAALRSEGGADPEWATSPFVELLGTRGGFTAPGALALEGVSERGWVHVAVAAVGTDDVAFVLTVTPEGIEGAERPAHGIPRGIPRGIPPVAEHATRLWAEALAAYPRFSCSDPWLERYFDYRAYGLHLNRIEGGAGRIPRPAVAEGIEYFHLPITYSAQCHMMETRWAADPAVARGSLLNFLAVQRDDGSLPGRLYVNHETGEDFYHANWADAALAVDALHPDPAFLENAYAGLSRYADWLRRERDPEDSGMITVVNHYETGQEYMSRYVAVDAASDVTEWEPRLRLKGVDVTVYTYQLLRGLASMAGRLGRGDEQAAWTARAERVGRAILEAMWDPDAGIFSDVDGGTGERTGVKAAVCFYPLLTDLLDDGHVARLVAHLSDPATFATEFPLPSSSADDPLFDAEGLWKGKRHNCPWNGRVWPMTNSHVVEGLIRQWHRGRAAAGPLAAHILTRFVRMMYHDGDLARPNCYEHYNPRTGHACVFRGIDDYQHSWVLDLLARGVCGVEPGAEAVRVHPLPMGLEEARFRTRLRGREVEVRVHGGEVEARIDGSTHRTTIGSPLEVAW
jgi:hypothetical protein